MRRLRTSVMNGVNFHIAGVCVSWAHNGGELCVQKLRLLMLLLVVLILPDRRLVQKVFLDDHCCLHNIIVIGSPASLNAAYSTCGPAAYSYRRPATEWHVHRFSARSTLPGSSQRSHVSNALIHHYLNV